MNSAPRLPRALLLGVSFISMAMLLMETILTRIFSVTMYYHFAFMVVSITLFGIGVSGIYVYLNPGRFPREKAGRQMAGAATLFALSVPACYFLQRSLPSSPSSPDYGLIYLTLTYTIIAVPFFLGGLAISLALTHFTSGVATLYFADLVGASVGCALVFPGLTLLTGPDIVAVVGVLGAGAALAFASHAGHGPARGRAWATLAALVLLLALNVAGVRILNVGTEAITNPVTGKVMKPLAVGWNPMSRVVAYRTGTRPAWRPGTPHDSLFYPEGQVHLLLDKSAQTYAVPFDGDFRKVDWIFADVSALPLFLKPGAKVLDIGSGAGQHALTAIGLGSKDISCVEINPTVVRWTKTRFDALTGHIYNRPEVRVFVGDGRTFAARSREKYDVISFVSSTTFTATASGAFMMAENNLFTVEAFRAYYDHLTPDGMIAVSQVITRDYSGLLLRVCSLGRRVLEDHGVARPADHVLVVMRGGEGVGNVLIKKSPFTTAELDQADSLAARMNWVVLHSPRADNDSQFHAVLAAPDFRAFARGLPINLHPPTDDQPFFFNLVPFSKLGATQAGNFDIKYGKLPAQILLRLFFIVLVLTLLFLIVPLVLARRARLPREPGTPATLGYFMMIGLGFIMVEVPLMQRFVLFLGHPIYAITVILFSLLLFSGIGSFLTRGVTVGGAARWLKLALPALLILLAAYNISLERIFTLFQEQAEPLKIGVSVLLLLPLGLLMGMSFPAMMRRVAGCSPTLVPWCWGVNGATSVLGSVTGVIVALSYGFGASLLAGMLAYAAALGCVLLLPRPAAPAE